jgi:hypothetical protein
MPDWPAFEERVALSADLARLLELRRTPTRLEVMVRLAESFKLRTAGPKEATWQVLDAMVEPVDQAIQHRIDAIGAPWINVCYAATRDQPLHVLVEVFTEQGWSGAKIEETTVGSLETKVAQVLAERIQPRVEQAFRAWRERRAAWA